MPVVPATFLNIATSSIAAATTGATLLRSVEGEDNQQIYNISELKDFHDPVDRHWLNFRQDTVLSPDCGSIQ